MSNKTSQHILPTAANLLGFCLIVITSLHLNSATSNSIIDEIASIVAVLLCISVMFSFASIKTTSFIWTKRWERMAEILFGIAILGIAVIVMVLMKKFWLK